MTRRETVDVGGVTISYLTAGKGGPLVLLLHGTYWSRVWQPVLDGIAAAGLRPVAVDFPGFGRSGGELTLSEASVPRLSAWLVQFLDALEHQGPVMVAGHDIGGGVAQHLMLANKVEVPRVAVVNGIMYDSWPVPGVARFRDPAVAAATTRDDVLAARRVSVVKALGRPASEAEIDEYLDPWTDPRVARSWLALAGAADHRYTMEMLPALLQSKTPKLLVWGVEDGFQTVDAKMVDRVGAVIVDLEKDKSLYPKDWVIPGGNPASAALDLARTTCRRSERHVAMLKDPNPEILRYLNRLSDFCWILARYCEQKQR